jgi:hypothetical protein
MPYLRRGRMAEQETCRLGPASRGLKALIDSRIGRRSAVRASARRPSRRFCASARVKYVLMWVQAPVRPLPLITICSKEERGSGDSVCDFSLKRPSHVDLREVQSWWAALGARTFQRNGLNSPAAFPGLRPPGLLAQNQMHSRELR